MDCHHEEKGVMYTDGKWRLQYVVYYGTNVCNSIVSDLCYIYRWLTKEKKWGGSTPNTFFHCEDRLMSWYIKKTLLWKSLSWNRLGALELFCLQSSNFVKNKSIKSQKLGMSILNYLIVILLGIHWSEKYSSL